MRFGSVLAAFAVGFAAAPAGAHVAGVVTTATFSSPPAPTITMTSGVTTVSPFTFPTADTSYPLMWSESTNGNDPTGVFTFYYLDHQPTFGLTADQLATMGTPIIDQANPASPLHIYCGCTCNPDAGVGVMCADMAGTTRDCRTSFVWDTHAIVPGAYWVFSVTHDPPSISVTSMAQAPVIISHGGPAPPAALFARPDGFNSFDKSYTAQWIATGTPPLTFDLAYGDEQSPMATPTPFASGLSIPPNGDGSYSYDWDVSTLQSLHQYYLRLTVHDGNGAKTFTDSHYAVSVYHPLTTDDLSVVDLSTDDGALPPPDKKGCSFDPGAAGATTAPLALALLTTMIAVRRARRRP
jgi:hypothetical protein